MIRAPPASSFYPATHTGASQSYPGTTTGHSPSDLDVVVFGHIDYTAAITVGITAAVEVRSLELPMSPVVADAFLRPQGPPANSPEGAIRKLLTTTCELLNTFMPKVGSHQRNINGGGVFDEDLINADHLIEAQRRSGP